MEKKRKIGEEWKKVHIKKNIITLIINKNKVSYRGFYDAKGNEFTGSSTGSFNLSGEKLIIPKSLNKYVSKEKSRYTGESQIKIKIPESMYKNGKFIKLITTSTVHKYASWERGVGVDILKVRSQNTFQK